MEEASEGNRSPAVFGAEGKACRREQAASGGATDHISGIAVWSTDRDSAQAWVQSCGGARI